MIPWPWKLLGYPLTAEGIPWPPWMAGRPLSIPHLQNPLFRAQDKVWKPVVLWREWRRWKLKILKVKKSAFAIIFIFSLDFYDYFHPGFCGVGAKPNALTLSVLWSKFQFSILSPVYFERFYFWEFCVESDSVCWLICIYLLNTLLLKTLLICKEKFRFGHTKMFWELIS